MRHHPRLSTPLALRLSRWSLPTILATYVLAVVAWILLLSSALHVLVEGSEGFAATLRTAATGMWSPGDILAPEGASSVYYGLAALNALVSVLLPVFLLGAFVFKLFRHDPLIWRKRLTLEAHTSGNYVLAARFYNRFTVTATDVRVRAWLRWCPAETPTVVRNGRLLLLVGGGKVVEEVAFPIAGSKEPTTVRIALCPTSAPTPLLDDGRTMMIQGDRVPRATAKLVLIVDGITSCIGEPFHSVTEYELNEELVELEPFQDIPPEEDKTAWEKFDGTQEAWVFVYGSLMRRDDLAAVKITAEDAIRPASLMGHRRVWNVASDPAAKNRVFRHRNTDQPYDGFIVSLGLEPHDGGVVRGMIVRVDYRALANFDRREQDYVRTDVTRFVPDVTPDMRVFTYIPKAEAVMAYERQRASGTLAITRDYLESVKRAAQNVSQDCLRDVEAAPGADIDVIDLYFEEAGLPV